MKRFVGYHRNAILDTLDNFDKSFYSRYFAMLATCSQVMNTYCKSQSIRENFINHK